MDNKFSFSSEVWEYGGKGSWYFASVPKEISEVISEVSETKRAFGSVKVFVTIGKSSWLTSLFPDTKKGVYLLPIKKDVRTKNNIETGSNIEVTVKLIND